MSRRTLILNFFDYEDIWFKGRIKKIGIQRFFVKKTAKIGSRSEEGRGGKGGKFWWVAEPLKKKKKSRHMINPRVYTTQHTSM